MSSPLPPKSIAVVLGTRPEVVKLAHVIRMLGEAALVVHSGQHYDDSLSRVFFDAFELDRPDTSLEIGGADRGTQIGEATRLLTELLTDRSPLGVVVQGDTNTTVAGAIAANATETPLFHVEAGLRSFDRRMPEEHNRVITDHLADLCLAPTSVNVANLNAEQIAGDRVIETGNTVVEAVGELLAPPQQRNDIVAGFGLERERFVLTTLHRPENVDDPKRLAGILEQLDSLPLPIFYPMHPRTARTVADHGLDLGEITTSEPLDYTTFLALAAEAAALVSDSGGIQEEVSIIKRPVAIVRRSTERPEVLGTFASLVDAEDGIAGAVAPWLADPTATHAALGSIPSPYGDGTASQRTVDAIAQLVG